MLIINIFFMDKRTKISVIIPVYNTSNYLRDAFNSILTQSLHDIEIIAINDGSTDNSLDVLRELQKIDSRIKIFTQENLGVSIARNKGIELATGKYIYFFDSDDILSRNCLLDCYKRAENTDCDFICFNADSFYDGISEINKTNDAYNKANILKSNKNYKGYYAWDLLRHHDKASPSVCLCFIRKNYLNSIQLSFFPNIIHEDRLFTYLLYLQASCIQYIPKTYFHRRKRKDSITTTPYSMKNVYGLLTVCKELYLFKEKQNSLSKELTHSINKEIKNIVNTIASSSFSLPFSKRLWILKKLIHNYIHFLDIKSILLLLLPILKLKK